MGKPTTVLVAVAITDTVLSPLFVMYAFCADAQPAKPAAASIATANDTNIRFMVNSPPKATIVMARSAMMKAAARASGAACGHCPITACLLLLAGEIAHTLALVR